MQLKQTQPSTIVQKPQSHTCLEEQVERGRKVTIYISFNYFSSISGKGENPAVTFLFVFLPMLHYIQILCLKQETNSQIKLLLHQGPG